MFDLDNRCHFDSRCWNYHSPTGQPYQWMWRSPTAQKNSWKEFDDMVNKTIELAYCEARNDFCLVADKGTKSQTCVNFEYMTLQSNSINGDVKRCGTASMTTAGRRNRLRHFHTTWKWYYYDIHREQWQEYIGASTDRVMSSDAIESTYLANPFARIRYTTRSSTGAQMELDLKRMILTNQVTQAISEIRRRP